MTLEDLRNRIDQLDAQLLALLNQRMAVVRQVGDLKKANNALIYRPEREKAILDRLYALNDGLLNQPAIDAIFLEIFAVARNIELPERIAYLGPEGSFTHQAAESRFGAMSDYTPLGSIRAVFESVETSRVRFGVVPIENNREGIVSETIDLLQETDIRIVAEVLISVHFAFATQCEKLSDIRHIYSKDIAFRQCSKFLGEYFENLPAEQVPVESTSKAARLAAKDPRGAAICSHIAAKLFDVPVLFPNIEDSPNNRTRFLIISKDFVNQRSESDKTTLAVKLPDTPGSLAGFLQEFNDQQINITKIESRPAREGNLFKSWFYIDFNGHYHDGNVQTIVEKHRERIKWLGSYVKLC
ncbi:MAG: prephenate dehydratase [Ferruginibacter sp.]|nr:prephenate dehydratase [Cytophagales bacterium]